MTQRLNYASHAKPIYNALYGLTKAIHASSLDKSLVHLVNLRVSQLNGCAFCVDMHSKEAKIDGEKELRLYHLAVWHESPLFSARERAALEWAELVTKLPPRGVPQEAFEAVSKEFSEQEVSELTFAVAAINAWNRLGVPFTSVPGSADDTMGLRKAGLSEAA